MPTWEETRRAVQELALERGVWSGYPMPVHGPRIIAAERHEAVRGLDLVTLGPFPDEPPSVRVCSTVACNDGIRVRNEWWSSRLASYVYVYEDEDGKIGHVFERWAVHLGALHRWGRLLETFTTGRQAWSARAEMHALTLLAELIQTHEFESYLLTGMFVESSKRSQCVYAFRKGRPTVVLQRQEDGNFRPRITLCLHPVAYYQGTFAGGLVPTDDVIAHLLLMRSDEPRLWRQANQHPIDRPEAGL